MHLLRYLSFGHGGIAPVTREALCQADPRRRQPFTCRETRLYLRPLAPRSASPDRAAPHIERHLGDEHVVRWRSAPADRPRDHP